MQKQDKPIIIAICGKSATGKNVLLTWLLSMARATGFSITPIVSDTTRPPRPFEQDKIDYNFLTDNDFHYKINNGDYLEYSSFNGWFYGTDKTSINSNIINVGIFNLDGMSSLANYQNNFKIICIYLECNLFERLIRSYQREGIFKLEYLRRAYADYRDFKNVTDVLNRFSKKFIFDSSKVSTVSMVDHILWQLRNLD